MPQILDIKQHAITRAIAGDWSVADRIELYWLADQVTPYTEDGDHPLAGKHVVGARLVPIRIARGWGPQARTIVEWSLGYHCPMCICAPYWQAMECKTCSGRGHLLGWGFDPSPAGVVVRTDLDGLVIEELWAQ